MTDSGAPSFDSLRVSVDGSVAVLELHRPSSLNPLSTTCMEEIIVAARWFDAQPEIKVVIVRGAGRVFSAGADVTSFGSSGAALGRDAADVGRRMADAVEAMRAVTVAQIHGWCVGGGVVLAAACDLRLVAAGTQFSIPEVDLGIPLAWGGIPRLVREIGPALAKELVMTCRPFGAEEAARIGFVNRVVPGDELDTAVTELARTLASKATYALLSTKRYVNAVTAQMVGLDRSWSDADTLVAGLHDPEGRAKQAEYLAGLAARRRERSS
jgi:enoyl-CoA hydratase/carnithine racemase